MRTRDGNREATEAERWLRAVLPLLLPPPGRDRTPLHFPQDEEGTAKTRAGVDSRDAAIKQPRREMD